MLETYTHPCALPPVTLVIESGRSFLRQILPKAGDPATTASNAAVVANRHDLEGRNPDAAHRLTGARAGAETYASIGRAVGMQRAAAVNTRGESFRFRAPLRPATTAAGIAAPAARCLCDCS